MTSYFLYFILFYILYFIILYFYFLIIFYDVIFQFWALIRSQLLVNFYCVSPNIILPQYSRTTSIAVSEKFGQFFSYFDPISLQELKSLPKSRFEQTAIKVSKLRTPF